MKYCMECGTQLDDAAKYCSGCGTVQSSDQKGANVIPATLAATLDTQRANAAVLDDAASMFIVGIIVEPDLPILSIPHSEGNVITTIPRKAEVIVVSRDLRCEWLNIIFMGTAAREVIGWIPVTGVADVQLQGNSVRANDLPISSYQWNTKMDIKELIAAKVRTIGSIQRIPVTLPLLGGFALLIGGFMPAIMMSIEFESQSFAILMVYIVVAVGLIVLGFVNMSRIQPKIAPLQKEVRQLSELVKSAQDRALEHHAKVLAMNTAAGMMTRIVPNRQENIVKHK